MTTPPNHTNILPAPAKIVLVGFEVPAQTVPVGIVSPRDPATGQATGK